MADPCFGSLQACRLRVALLDANGSPDNGASNGYVTDALIDVSFSPQIEEGEEFLQKNGCGDICQSAVEPNKIKRVDVEINLCHLDSALIGLLTGATVFVDGGTGDPMGVKLPKVGDVAPYGVCLEVWSKAWDGGAQATPAQLAQAAAYWHWVVPKYRPAPGDFTLEAGILQFPVTGPGEENPRITANGPFDDWPTEVAITGGIDSALGWFLDSNLPDANCDYLTVSSLAS